jgi:hypothetical protein
MLLATLVVLLQMPIAPAGKLPAQPQAAAPVLVAENTPAKFPPPSSSANPFAPAPQTDLFDRDKIRLVDISKNEAAADDKSNSDANKVAGMRDPNADPEEASAILAEVHIPTHVEPAPPDNFHPEHITAERQGHTWLALSIAQHGAATFDAWSTRRAINEGHQEMNPILRPFAGNASIYAVIQVGPSIFDYVGRRMQRSDKRVLREFWWLPQSLGTAASLFAGAHNLSVTH